MIHFKISTLNLNTLTSGRVKRRADTWTYSRPNAADLMRKSLLKPDKNLPLVLYKLTSLPASGSYTAKISSSRQNSL